MTLPNYIRPNGNMIDIDFQQLPDDVFLDAVKDVDICQFIVLSGKERNGIKPGDPDVKVMSITTGESRLISRQELCNGYRLPNGKKIKLAFLKNNKKYTCTSRCSKQYKVMAVPDNCKGTIKLPNGSVIPVKPGSVVIVPLTMDGHPDKTHMFTTEMRYFKKGFRVPDQAILQRNRNKPKQNARNFTLHKQGDTNINGGSMQRFGVNPPIRTGNQINTMDPAFRQPQQHGQMQGQVPQFRQPQQPVQPRPNNATPIQQRPQQTQQPVIQREQLNKQNKPVQEPENKYKFTVVNKVISMTSKQELGFTIEEIETKKTKVISSVILMQLCEQHLVDNVSAVKDSRGVKFLRGNGIVLKNLPTVLG
jgi:hypothetical protein